MTALSNLDLSDPLLRRERPEEIQTPTTPRASAMTRVEFPVSAPTDAASVAVSASPPHSVSSNYPDIPLQEQTEGSNQNHTHQSAESDEPWNAMDLDGSDHDQDGSDNETENGEQETSTRKKKGQRFFCTGYPPCNLSFTRSEHLARHIRKHTGERPFQCHCNRRFSRLDNLRQHAQTVHVNEEIPGDSLAATGTRFQRQIRTDRVRPAGRPRTNTMSSTGSHGRGHSRNMSNSSIGSTSSNFSTSTEPRRRPQPLLMASDGRPKLGIEPPSTPPAQYRTYGTNSPGGMSTPTSTTYSATPGSPGYGSSIGSPNSTASRASGFFSGRTPARRLSVPSGTNPFQPQYSNSYPMPYMAPNAPSSGMSNNPSVFASPVSSNFSPGPAYPLLASEDWRRRTWHPSTYPASAMNYGRPATSGLTYSQTPDAPQPAFAQNALAAAAQAPRLPGIESFDQVQHRPSTPPRRQPSPMQVNVAPQGPPHTVHDHGIGSGPGPAIRSGHVSWDSSRNTVYAAPEEHRYRSDDSMSWSQQTIHELQNVASCPEEGHRSTNMGPPPIATNMQHPQQIAQEALQLQPPTPKRNKRQGWYIGPPPAIRTSPEDSSSSEGISTPGTSAMDVNPAIMHSNGYIEPQHQVLAADGTTNTCAPPPHSHPTYTARMDNHPHSSPYANPRRGSNDMAGLEALVAVATSEEKATASIR